MADDAANVRKLLRQQAAIAAFGSSALRQSDLLTVTAATAAQQIADWVHARQHNAHQHKAGGAA
jgi:hypothetical protein